MTSWIAHHWGYPQLLIHSDKLEEPLILTHLPSADSRRREPAVPDSRVVLFHSLCLFAVSSQKTNKQTILPILTFTIGDILIYFNSNIFFKQLKDIFSIST